MLVVLIGPPGAGKTTWARAQAATHLATDDLRLHRGGSVTDHAHDDEIAARFDAAVLAAIERRSPVIVENGANVRRCRYLEAARAANHPAEVRVYENYAEALAHALTRRDVPLTELRWTELAAASRRAAAAVEGEGWDAVHRVS